MRTLLIILLSIAVCFAGTRTNTDTLSVTKIRAAGSGGLSIQDDGGNVGVFVEDGGFLGVGTNNPLVPFHIKKTSVAYGRLANFERADANEADFVITSVNASDIYIGSTKRLSLVTGADSLSNAGTTRIQLDTTGNVGIGTTNPTTLLDVNGQAKSLSFSTGACSTTTLVNKDSIAFIQVDGFAGLALRVTAGEALTKGNIVEWSTAADYRVKKAVQSNAMPVGVCAANIGNGESGWIIISGFGPVKFASGITPTRGYVAYVSSTDGEADCASSIDAAQHNSEIGHVIVTGSSGGTVMCQLHWN